MVRTPLERKDYIPTQEARRFGGWEVGFALIVALTRTNPGSMRTIIIPSKGSGFSDLIVSHWALPLKGPTISGGTRRNRLPTHEHWGRNHIQTTAGSIQRVSSHACWTSWITRLNISGHLTLKCKHIHAQVNVCMIERSQVPSQKAGKGHNRYSSAPWGRVAGSRKNRSTRSPMILDFLINKHLIFRIVCYVQYSMYLY